MEGREVRVLQGGTSAQGDQLVLPRLAWVDTRTEPSLFREEAVRLVREGSKSLPQVAKDLVHVQAPTQ